MGTPVGVTTLQALVKIHLGMMRKYARDLEAGPSVVNTKEIIKRIKDCAEETEAKFNVIIANQQQRELDL